jgi:hypothetical protein
LVAIVAALLLTSSNSGGPTIAAPADPTLVQTVSNVPDSAFDAVGLGATTNPPETVSEDALAQDGKPELLYIGAEYCPYCAAERWAMVVALSRFGTFSDLKTTRSSPSDVFPNTATFSFYGSTYRSNYLVFEPVEMYSTEPTGGGYAKLQSATSDQLARINASGGGFPFLDFGGKFVISGTSYSPGVISGMDWQTIASTLTQTDSKPAQAIIGTANVLTAAICRLTDGKPESVCSSPGVQAADAYIH